MNKASDIISMFTFLPHPSPPARHPFCKICAYINEFTNLVTHKYYPEQSAIQERGRRTGNKDMHRVQGLLRDSISILSATTTCGAKDIVGVTAQACM